MKAQCGAHRAIRLVALAMAVGGVPFGVMAADAEQSAATSAVAGASPANATTPVDTVGKEGGPAAAVASADAAKADAAPATAAASVAEAAKGDAKPEAKPGEETKAAAPSRSPEDLYKDGQKAIGDGDLIAAMPLFKKAADAGYAPAQVSVAELFLSSDYFVESVEYFRKAADQGNADGEYGLANSYVEGKGIAKDYKQALEWYTKAAEQKHPQATDALAVAYANGGLGLTQEERNSEKAFHWIDAAAKQDNLLAMRALAYAYKTGAFGAPINQAQADVWDAKVKEIEAKYKTKKKKGKQ